MKLKQWYRYQDMMLMMTEPGLGNDWDMVLVMENIINNRDRIIYHEWKFDIKLIIRPVKTTYKNLQISVIISLCMEKWINLSLFWLLLRLFKVITNQAQLDVQQRSMTHNGFMKIWVLKDSHHLGLIRKTARSQPLWKLWQVDV